MNCALRTHISYFMQKTHESGNLSFIFFFLLLIQLMLSSLVFLQVSIPIGLQREVDALLGDYLSRKRANRESFPTTPFSRSSSTDSFATDEGLFEQQEPQSSTRPVMEKILRRRSLHLRNQQQNWQVQFHQLLVDCTTNLLYTFDIPLVVYIVSIF